MGTVVANKPGFPNLICIDHRLAVSRALVITRMNLRNIMLREHIPIFHDKDRNLNGTLIFLVDGKRVFWKLRVSRVEVCMIGSKAFAQGLSVPVQPPSLK